MSFALGRKCFTAHLEGLRRLRGGGTVGPE